MQGVCRSARDCPQAFQNPSRNPDLCMFTRNDVVICCPKVEASALTLDIHPVGGVKVEEDSSRTRISQLSEWTDLYFFPFVDHRFIKFQNALNTKS